MTESVNAYLAPIRERRRELEGQPEMVREILHEGNRRANEIANTTLDEVREAMGMVYLPPRASLSIPRDHGVPLAEGAPFFYTESSRSICMSWTLSRMRWAWARESRSSS